MAKLIKLQAKIGLDDALAQVMRKCPTERSPAHYASYVLGRAIECGYVALFVDDAKVDPSFFRSTLFFISDQDADGHWHGWIDTHAALVKPLDAYTWSLSRAELRQFLADYDRVSGRLGL